MKLRGHEIKLIGSSYYYADTGEPTSSNWTKRPCGNCGEHNTPEGHDACIGTLPNVMNACCGHGQDNDAYIQYWDGVILRGSDAILKIKKV